MYNSLTIYFLHTNIVHAADKFLRLRGAWKLQIRCQFKFSSSFLLKCKFLAIHIMKLFGENEGNKGL